MGNRVAVQVIWKREEKKHQEECSSCDGIGTIYWNGKEVKCPTCNGTGKKK